MTRHSGYKHAGITLWGNKTVIMNKQIFVTGQVQGVFFRDSTRQKAIALKLSGMVRNLQDGRVEVQVKGEMSDVQTLIKWLEIGPKLAKVSTIEVIDLALTATDNQGSTEFEIWPTALTTK